MNVQNTAGKNNLLTDYLSRHPTTYIGESEIENKANGLEGIEAEEEFVITQIHGLFEFNPTNESITQFIGQTAPSQGTEK